MVVCKGKPQVDNEGIFQTAIALWKRFANDGTTENQKKLHEIMTWLNDNLEVPKKVPNYGIFWFKEGSSCIELCKELCKVLNKNKVKTSYYISENPGKILYEDKHQVQAVYNRRVKCIVIDRV